MIKIILLLLGISMSSAGLCCIYLYLNLLTMGYSFFEFVNFIIRRVECLQFLFGIGLILFATKGWLKSEFLLRHRTKF